MDEMAPDEMALDEMASDAIGLEEMDSKEMGETASDAIALEEMASKEMGGMASDTIALEKMASNEMGEMASKEMSLSKELEGWEEMASTEPVPDEELLYTVQALTQTVLTCGQNGVIAADQGYRGAEVGTFLPLPDVSLQLLPNACVRVCVCV